MAEKTGKTKGVAFLKRAKIDRAQSIMLAAVCGASLVLGVSAVGTVRLVKLIKYNAGLLSYEEDARDTYKSVQENLESIKAGVDGLQNNEALESVARNTPGRIAGCDKYDPSLAVDDENYDIGLAKMCSSLRVIPEAIPVISESGDVASVSYTSHASFEEMLNWSELPYEGLSASEATEVFPDTIHTLGFGITVTDEAERLKRGLSMIENSIRNFDLQSASIRFNSMEVGETGQMIPTIEFSGVYGMYYADRVDVEVRTEVFCANPQNKKCPGDTLRNGGGGQIDESE